MIIETHTHFCLDDFDNDRDFAIDRAKDAGVERFVEIGFDLLQSRKALELARSRDDFFCTIGVHPHDAKSIFDGNVLEELEKMSTDKKVVGWGEMGLDYYRDISPRDVQRKAFLMQLEIAYRKNLPFVIHSREATEDMKGMIDDCPNDIRGVIHSFSGDVYDAWFYIERGLLIGVNCTITYPKNEKLRNIILDIPLEKIVLETDSPYLPPQTFRGKRNEPAYLKYIIDEISRIKELDAKNIEDVTSNTAKKLFGID